MIPKMTGQELYNGPFHHSYTTWFSHLVHAISSINYLSVPAIVSAASSNGKMLCFLVQKSVKVYVSAWSPCLDCEHLQGQGQQGIHLCTVCTANYSDVGELLVSESKSWNLRNQSYGHPVCYRCGPIKALLIIQSSKSETSESI